MSIVSRSTDRTLPKMTGIVLSQKILKIHPDIPIILCSGVKEHDIEAQVKSLGIKTYGSKPLTKRELAGIVRDTLEGRERRNNNMQYSISADEGAEK